MAMSLKISKKEDVSIICTSNCTRSELGKTSPSCCQVLHCLLLCFSKLHFLLSFARWQNRRQTCRVLLNGSRISKNASRCVNDRMVFAYLDCFMLKNCVILFNNSWSLCSIFRFYAFLFALSQIP